MLQIPNQGISYRPIYVHFKANLFLIVEHYRSWAWALKSPQKWPTSKNLYNWSTSRLFQRKPEWLQSIFRSYLSTQYRFFQSKKLQQKKHRNNLRSLNVCRRSSYGPGRDDQDWANLAEIMNRVKK